MPAPFGTPTYWNYDHVYKAVITAILRTLNQAEYVLNFSVIALHVFQPKAVLRFTLQSLVRNHSTQWEIMLHAPNVPQLVAQIMATIELRQLMLENQS